MKAVIEIFDSSVTLEQVIAGTLSANVHAVTEARQITAEMAIGTIIKGDDGKSAYQAAIEGGYTGSEAAFNEAISNQQIIETIPGSSVVLDLLGSHTYLCGALTSLVIRSVEDSPRSAVIRFRSGAVATSLTLPDTLRVVGYARPEANRSYELDIAGRLAYINRF